MATDGGTETVPARWRNRTDRRPRSAKLRVGRHRQADAYHAAIEQHGIGCGTRGDGGDVRLRRIGAIDQREDRVRAVGRIEASLYFRRGDRPALGLTVAGVAGAAIAAEALEEWIAGVDAAAGRVGLQRAGRVGGNQRGRTRQRNRRWMVSVRRLRVRAARQREQQYRGRSGQSRMDRPVAARPSPSGARIRKRTTHP